MFLVDEQNLTLILLAVCIIPIAALIIVAFVFRFRNAAKKAQENKNNEEEIDENQIAIFKEAYGGANNITEVCIVRNKVIVEVVDTTLVNGEKLVELGASGVLIVGLEVRASYSDRAKKVYEILK